MAFDLCTRSGYEAFEDALKEARRWQIPEVLRERMAREEEWERERELKRARKHVARKLTEIKDDTPKRGRSVERTESTAARSRSRSASRECASK